MGLIMIIIVLGVAETKPNVYFTPSSQVCDITSQNFHMVNFKVILNLTI